MTNHQKIRLDILIRSRDVSAVAVPFLHTVLEKNEHEFDKPQTKKQRVKQKELLAKVKRTVDDIQKDFDKVTHLAARQSQLARKTMTRNWLLRVPLLLNLQFLKCYKQ